jgi:hypothetical protein
MRRQRLAQRKQDFDTYSCKLEAKQLKRYSSVSPHLAAGCKAP